MAERWSIDEVSDGAFGFARVASQAAALVLSVSDAFMRATHLRFVWELKECMEGVGRAAVQFSVDPAVFDMFFNSLEGYRGMYRRGPWIGNCVNSLACAAIKNSLQNSLSETVHAWVLAPGPEVSGASEIESRKFLRSLDPSLAKLWHCMSVIGSSGELLLLSSGLSDRRIEVGYEYEWRAIEREPSECILELKGAFVANFGLFQTKAPETRASGLARTGEA